MLDDPCCALQLPGDIKLNYFDKENNMQEISVEELTKGKKVCRHAHCQSRITIDCAGEI